MPFFIADVARLDLAVLSLAMRMSLLGVYLTCVRPAGCWLAPWIGRSAAVALECRAAHQGCLGWHGV